MSLRRTRRASDAHSDDTASAGTTAGDPLSVARTAIGDPTSTTATASLGRDTDGVDPIAQLREALGPGTPPRPTPLEPTPVDAGYTPLDDPDFDPAGVEAEALEARRLEAERGAAGQVIPESPVESRVEIPEAIPVETPHETPADTSALPESGQPEEPPLESTPRLVATPEDSSAPTVPAFVEYRPSSLPAYLFGAAFILAAVGSVVAIFAAVEKGTSSSLLLAAVVTVASLACWWGVSSWTPTIVSISNGSLEVSRGAKNQRFDLRNPDTDVRLGDNPRSPSWRAIVVSPGGDRVVIARRRVRAAQFSRIVEHYRTHATAESEHAA